MAAQYYNEHDAYAAQWLRNLIAAGHLPPGDVDTRSIVDVQPEDLIGYEQCHWFAGIGVWPYALGRNDWRERSGLWTGSCPCQPFSAAGRQLGFDDERHLWPAWFHLITQRRPAIVLGEQVSSALAWLDLVRDDLESAGYAVGAADLCAPGFPVANWSESPNHEWLLRALYDCPDPVVAAELLDFASFASGNLGAHDGDHIRQRLYFVGMADGEYPGLEGFAGDGDRGYEPGRVEARPNRPIAAQGPIGGVGDAFNTTGERYARGFPSAQTGLDGARLGEHGNMPLGPQYAGAGIPSRMADSERGGRQQFSSERPASVQPEKDRGRVFEPGDVGTSAIPSREPDALDERGGNADWLYCRDGKWRPTGPGAFPLVNAAPSRVGRLRAYGNALDAQTVIAFIASVRECAP